MDYTPGYVYELMEKAARQTFASLILRKLLAR